MPVELLAYARAGGVGAAARHETHDCEQVDFVVAAGNAAYDNQRYDGDDETPDYPPHTGGVEYRCGEVLAGGDTDGCEEEAYAEFAEQKRRRGRGVCDEFGAIAETAQKDCHDEGAACEAEFHVEAEVYLSEHDAEYDAYENGYEVRLVEAFHRVAETVGKPVNILEVAHNSEAVAHLEAEVGRCEKVDAGTVYTGGVEFVAVVQAQRA